MLEKKKENQGFDQESSDEEEKMSEKPFSSYSEPHEGKSKIKSNGASGPAPAPGGASGSSVRVCDFCGKQFNSGKALGGHRRYHIQAQKKLEAQNLAQQKQEKVNYTLKNKAKDLVIPDYDDNNNLIKSRIVNFNSSSSRSFRCCVCDKDFPSEKSLYGHMRSHPEREWRGMNPPFVTDNNLDLSSPSAEQLNNGSSSSTLEESSSPVPVDLSSSCSGSSWLKKDKRGRVSGEGEAEAAHIAAITLIHMHLYGNDELEAQTLRGREATPEEAALLPVKKRKNNVMKKNHVADYKEKLDGRDGNEELEAENNMWDVKVKSLIKEKKLNKQNKKLKLGAEIKSEGEPLVIRTLKQEEVKPQSYVCGICNKSFSCFQALGGHKSKHNREKNIAKSMKGKELMEQSEEKEEEEDKMCINGTLLSSAGLSGEEEEASPISSEERLAISSNDNNEDNGNGEEVGEASQQSASKIRGFDLNMPYVLEHEATDL
ncbi:hypothetical protein QN277_016583 [Acacia crassicarpa]|uniref:C2H2-type domain-containing protein n=1 Tax=Acacia crassicarpa TaxID=499986 RepID=A0AAE1MX21_9FABA|nr:hypothetical protein QN277_016583 [Acacia crassicarpa]